MRASRLLSILLLLQTRGRMTARELADELEVSVRTVYRDVDALSGAGVPIFADRGPVGGYQLVGGYRTRLTGLTPDEAESLFLAGIPGPAAELGLGTVLATAQLKLLAALPPELRSRAARIRERFHLDAPGWFREGDQPPHLAAVAEAVWNQSSIRMRYRRWGGEVHRTVDPLGLILKGGVWYLAAGIDGQIRTYRVSGILDLEILSDRFDRPEGFDLAEYWADWSRRYRRDRHKASATLRVSPLGFDLLPLVFNADAARAAHEGASAPDERGWRQVELPLEFVAQAHRDLLRLGAEAEVLGPPDLRERVRQELAALARMYQEP